jgi:hypothetical protein
VARSLPKEGETLPDPGAPLVLADGSLLHPDGTIERKKSSENVLVQSDGQAQHILAKTQRKLIDLPSTTDMCNASAVVLSYSLYGLSDEDIAIATNLSVKQVGIIRMSDVYTKLQEAVVEQIIESDSDNIRAFLSAASKSAAMRVVQISASQDEMLALAASKDILDRTGHRPAEIVNHKHTMDGGLRIEIVDKTSKTNTPNVTLTLPKLENVNGA